MIGRKMPSGRGFAKSKRLHAGPKPFSPRTPKRNAEKAKWFASLKAVNKELGLGLKAGDLKIVNEARALSRKPLNRRNDQKSKRKLSLAARIVFKAVREGREKLGQRDFSEKQSGLEVLHERIFTVGAGALVGPTSAKQLIKLRKPVNKSRKTSENLILVAKLGTSFLTK